MAIFIPSPLRLPFRVPFISSNDTLASAISITVTLLLVCILLGHLLHSYKWANESIVSLILGLCAGIVVYVSTKGRDSHILRFNEDLFFYYLLPPIIFNAGFQVKKKQFFKNFVAIMFFGVFGVFISFAIITVACKLIFAKVGLELSFVDLMAIGVIFSATDSVCTLQVLHQDRTPLLYSLVFGEGVMNDAASIVLFNAVQELDLSDVDARRVFLLIGKFVYLFLTSTLLGVAVGLISAYIIKKLYMGRHSTDREIAIMVLMPYLSYILAELLELSGILTVFFCGILMSHYTWHNVTEHSRTTTKHMFATMSFIAETFIFMYVGMDAFDEEKWQIIDVSPVVPVAIAGALLLATAVGRAAFVFPLSALSNLLRRVPGTEISFRQQVIIWWAGLMRGAVSVALLYNQFTAYGTTKNSTHALVISSTVIVVLVSTTVFGLLTKPLIDWLIPQDKRFDLTPKRSGLEAGLLSEGGSFDEDHAIVRSGSWQMLLSYPTTTVHYYWRKFDDGYMRPVFGGGL